MFAQTSAATAAVSRTAAPPVSVLRNARSGVGTVRDHAVRPAYGRLLGWALLLVAFDHLGAPELRLVGILAGVAQRAALA
jgi:hypothetical protein